MPEIFEVDGVEVEEPDAETLREWLLDGTAESLDGCQVEPDGTCAHGQLSWLVALGYL